MGIRNLIPNQLHIRNLVSLGYTAGDTDSWIRGGGGLVARELPRSLTPEAFFRGYLEREDEGRTRKREGIERLKRKRKKLQKGGAVVETGRHTNLFNYDPRLQL